MISQTYLELNRQLHQDPSIKYGYKGWQQADAVLACAREFEADSILDYGAGKRTLSAQLKKLGFLNVADFDPAISEISAPPEPADLVVCSDVMEHVEPNYLGGVISDLHRLTEKALFLRICTVPCTSKSLPDGSDPHRSIMPRMAWWSLFSGLFQYHGEPCDQPNYFTFILTPRKCPPAPASSSGQSSCHRQPHPASLPM